jgi:hypothetical protein
VVSGSNFTPGGAVLIRVLDEMPNPTITPGYDWSTVFTIGQANVTAGVEPLPRRYIWRQTGASLPSCR